MDPSQNPLNAKPKAQFRQQIPQFGKSDLADAKLIQNLKAGLKNKDRFLLF
jgi:hypothetical protein